MKVSPTDAEMQNDTTDQLQEDSSTSETTENTEESSTSETSEAEVSTFDLVKKALGGDEAEDDTEGSSEEDASEEAEDADEEKSKDAAEEKPEGSEEMSEEELSAMKHKTRKRFEDLQAKYRTATEELNSYKEKYEQAEVEAGHYRQFVGFLEENRLSHEEANRLFDIGALMKNDPVKALEAITPYVQQLLHMTGNVLSPDLQAQVQQGMMTHQAALEISRLRASGQISQAVSQERTQYQQQQDQNRQNQTVNAIQNGIANWEQNWSVSDPDYNVKKDRVLDRVELKLARAARSGNLPKTVEEAVELANMAKTEVENEIRQFRPKKQPVKTVQGGSSTTNVPEPKSTLDVIRRTLHQ